MHKIAHRHATHIGRQAANAGTPGSQPMPSLSGRTRNGMLSLDAPSGQRRHYSAGCGGTVAAPKWADLINRENTADMPTDWAALINTAVGPTAEVLLDSSDGSLVDLRDLIARISKERISDLPITIVGNDAMAPYGLHEDF